jgi:uncharacterized protein YqgC (DUF456 family)
MKEFKVSVKTESMFDVIKLVLGVVALVIGLAGLLLPILPGWILIFVGLELIGIKIVFIDKIKEYVIKKIEESKKKGKKRG